MLLLIVVGGQRLRPGVVTLRVFACLSREWPKRQLTPEQEARSTVTGGICHPEHRSSRAGAVRASRGAPGFSPHGSASRGPSTPRNVSRAKRFSPFRMTRGGVSHLLRRSQDLVPYIFQHVQGALHSRLAGKNGIFILDAENSLVADFHIREHDFFPGAGTMTVAHGAKCL